MHKNDYTKPILMMEHKFKSFFISDNDYYYLADKRDLLKLEYLR